MVRVWTTSLFGLTSVTRRARSAHIGRDNPCLIKRCCPFGSSPRHSPGARGARLGFLAFGTAVVEMSSSDGPEYDDGASASADEDAFDADGVSATGGMDPDHPLLARAQAALKKQLLETKTDLEERIRERAEELDVRANPDPRARLPRARPSPSPPARDGTGRDPTLASPTAR